MRVRCDETIGTAAFSAAQVARMSIEDAIRGAIAPMSILVLAILTLVLFLGPIRLLGVY